MEDTSMRECIIALDAGGTFLKSALFCGGELISGTLDKKSADSDGTLGEVHKAYCELMTKMKLKADMLGYTVKKVGVDIPGPFDYAAGVSLMKHKYTAIYGVPLRNWFYEIFGEGVEVSFIHDSAAFISGAVAQSKTGYLNTAGAMIGTGLGFAMMKDGKICSAKGGGPLISVYNRPFRNGTAEDFVSARGIVARYNAEAEKPLANAKEIGDLANAGDELAVRVYTDTGRALAEILGEILYENKTEALFLGGQISKSYNIFGKALEEGLKNNTALKLISPAPDIDTVHLQGIAAYFG